MKASTDPGLEHQGPGGLLFEHVGRYWDPVHGIHAAKLLPGEYYVTHDDMAIVTVLGSCVSACVRDSGTGVGGMNHFMLPSGREHGEAPEPEYVSRQTRYGNYAMERLVNDLLKMGGRRSHLEVKIFGGGRVMSGVTDIGERNVTFVRAYLAADDLSIAAEDVGGLYPRKVYFFPASGRVRVKTLRRLANDTVRRREAEYRERIEQIDPAGEVELF